MQLVQVYSWGLFYKTFSDKNHLGDKITRYTDIHYVHCAGIVIFLLMLTDIKQ